MARRRDTGRSKIYAATHPWEHGYPTTLTREECEILVRSAAPKLQIEVRFPTTNEDGRRWAWGGKTNAGNVRVFLPTWARKLPIVLHEVAHCLIPDDAAWHGREWRVEYLRLLREFGPPGLAEQVEQTMREVGVEV